MGQPAQVLRAGRQFVEVHKVERQVELAQELAGAVGVFWSLCCVVVGKKVECGALE